MWFTTDYERLIKPFFHWNTELLGLGRQIGQINSEAFGVFSNISTHFGSMKPLSMFSKTIISTKTKPSYPHPKYLFGIEIWIWAAKNWGFSLRVSVVRALTNDVLWLSRLTLKGSFSIPPSRVAILFLPSWLHDPLNHKKMDSKYYN